MNTGSYPPQHCQIGPPNTSYNSPITIRLLYALQKSVAPDGWQHHVTTMAATLPSHYHTTAAVFLPLTTILWQHHVTMLPIHANTVPLLTTTGVATVIASRHTPQSLMRSLAFFSSLPQIHQWHKSCQTVLWGSSGLDWHGDRAQAWIGMGTELRPGLAWGQSSGLDCLRAFLLACSSGAIGSKISQHATAHKSRQCAQAHCCIPLRICCLDFGCYYLLCFPQTVCLFVTLCTCTVALPVHHVH